MCNIFKSKVGLHIVWVLLHEVVNHQIVCMGARVIWQHVWAQSHDWVMGHTALGSALAFMSGNYIGLGVTITTHVVPNRD